MEQRVDISVCMATFNGARWLREQLDSILGQLGPEDELVISDDNSTDETLDIISTYSHPRIRLYPNANCRQPAANFGRALSLARGSILVLADQDDVWQPGRLEKIREQLSGAVSSCIMLDGEMVRDGAVVEPSIQAHLNSGPGLWRNVKKNTWMGCCMAFTADLLPWVLPIPRNIPMHDSWIGLLAELRGRVEFIPFNGIRYRMHAENRSLRGYSLGTRLRWRIELVTAIVLRLLRGKKVAA